MRKGYRSVVFVGVGLLAATVVLAGDLHRHGTVTPSSQTTWILNTPMAGATVYGIVEVRGFIFNPERGISKITLLVDGVAVHDADLNKPRIDVRRKYPGFDGEAFPVGPGFATSFLASNYEDGEHTIAVKVTYADATLGTGETETEVLGERTIIIDNTFNQPPLGALDSPRNPAEASMDDYVSGAYPITGWAIDDQGIRMTTDALANPRADIEVLVDGQVAGQSLYNLPRPDVANDHPDVAAAFLSGYQMNLDTTRFSNGMHTISVRAWDVMGKSRILGTRNVVFDNHYATLKPIGRIDFPMPNAHLYTTACNVGPAPSGLEYEPGNRIEWVSGWAVDQNDQQRFEGIKYLELLLDGAVLKKTNTDDCQYLEAFLQEVNCYGKPRPDILLQYPQFTADAKYSGFFFALDVDWLVNTLGVHQGLHYLAIRAGTQDPNRPAVIIDQIPVLIECPQWGGYPSFGELEEPETMQLMRGEETVKGWVIEPNDLVAINFYVDGILDGTLPYTDPNSHIKRQDLLLRYPFYPSNLLLYAGFEYTLDTSKYVDGLHQLVIETVDRIQQRNYWVQRAVVFDNPN
jgi:hypothetical protein